MNYTKIIRFRINKISLALCTVFSLLSIISFTTICVGQTEYETPGVLKAHDILPPELLESEYHTVMEEVATYDLTNRFTILSTFGPFEAIGEYMLRIRIQEIQAIAALQEIKKTKAFHNAAEQAAMSSFRGAKNLIIHPVDTVTGVPKGVGRLFSRVGEMVKGGRGDQEESVAKELVGFSRVKRQYAHKLGVDVYSSNKVLQKELNSVAWAGFAGGVGVSLATMPVKSASKAAYTSIKATKFTYAMNKIMLDNDPEDIRQINRELLQQMLVKELVIEEFLNHPLFSPRHETFIVHALAAMKGVRNRDQFIKQANLAVYEEDALFFQRIAEMMYSYHNNVDSFAEIIPVRRAVVGYTTGLFIVATLPIDYVYWTERADKGIEALLKTESMGRPPVKSMKLFITGRFSPKTKLKLMAKGIEYRENLSVVEHK